MFLARPEALAVAVAILVRRGCPHRQLTFHQRQIDGRTQITALVATEARLYLPRGFVHARAFRVHADGTGHGVLAEQCSLRPAQHFDGADIQEIQQSALHAAEVNAVEIDAHARIERGQEVDLAHAPNKHVGHVRAAAKPAG